MLHRPGLLHQKNSLENWNRNETIIMSIIGKTISLKYAVQRLQAAKPYRIYSAHTHLTTKTGYKEQSTRLDRQQNPDTLNCSTSN
jgi:hypothetical protein